MSTELMSSVGWRATDLISHPEISSITSGVVRFAFIAIYGLACIDPVDIDRAWVLPRAELLRDYPYHSTAVILFYVESTWLYNTSYPRDMWSVYHSIILKDPRTNNVSEASNNAFNIAAAASHLAMPKYVKHLQLFNAEGETLYHQQSTHQSVRRGARPRTENNDKRISDYVASEHTTAITLLSG